MTGTSRFAEDFGFALSGCGVGLLLAGSTLGLNGLWAAVAACCCLLVGIGGICSGRRRAMRAGKAEQALRIIESMPALAWSTDARGKFLYMSRRIRTLTGLSKKELSPLGRDTFGVRNVVHPDDYDRLLAAWQHSLATGDYYDLEHRIALADGVYRWFRNFASAERDQDGRIAAWYGTTIDVDDEKQAEAALLEREQQLSRLVDSVPGLIWSLAPDGEPTYFNKQMVQFTGLSIDQLDNLDTGRLAATVETIVHPDDAAVVTDAVRSAIATGEPFSLKHRLRRSDGVHRWVEARATPMRNAEGVVVQWYGVCLDIEDQVQAQDELRRTRDTLGRASQAASLAELSASIAHEVNQPLAAIVANSHACQRWLAADVPNVERAQVIVTRIIRDANAAANVVSRIRALFKQSTQEKRRATLGEIIAEARDLMIDAARQSGVSVAMQIEAGLPAVVCDRIQIQQVLINLIRNAIEAMEGLGDAKSLAIRARRSGGSVRIEISDRGPGVQSPDRIFEAFVTTKTDGMGMGLAICRSIVETHGGRLWTKTGPAGETTFTFTLPAEADEAVAV
ncbi:PAS domain-containing sensor histidine kinase [Bradyrhizobium sp. CER78]|uniref:PAS domain-containing sensor histidine kinase n=1 Tax=Bradyrhizobium sp. CER78 TaxID=3039162 RepID=UPI0024488DC1|nr:PAS domain-containing sensor histidine kinase [Bradyrhizobium sp. CER78]MDH2383693.1 PAS domain-containing protein [Bradyrhizobium sp. CER78]